MKGKNNSHGLIVTAIGILAIVGLVRHFHVKNLRIVEPGVLYTSGQPKGMDYTRLLYKYHIATIVNVRSAAEHREKNWYNEELTWVRDNGVKYVELPIDRAINRENYFPNVKTQQDFLSIMADKVNLPVLLHGSSGKKRVAMLTAVWLINSQGYGIEEAIKTVEKIKGEKVTEVEEKFIAGLAKSSTKSD